MKLKQILFSSLLSLTVAAGLRAEPPAVKTVTIACYDTMKYSVNTIEAKPGQKMVVEVKNEGSLPKAVMGHNWILLKAGVDPNAYAKVAMTAKADDYQPKSLADKVIAASPLLGAGESAKVAFTCPSTPGSYTYLCGCPGHAASGMRGVLIVK